MYNELAAILKCPITGEHLHFVEEIKDPAFDAALLAQIESQMGYLNTSKTNFYPIKDNIICLLPESSIGIQSKSTNKAILSVQEFYNQFGWVKNEQEQYHDNKLFVDQRDFADEYNLNASLRIVEHLSKKQGKYLLDIASGPVYQKSYKRFSENFDYRICVDISIKALMEAQKNLANQKVIFIMGDITNIPLQDNVCDGVVSMHTLYHVHKDKQADGVSELVRVSKPTSKVIIAYNWGWHSMLMNLALFPSRLIRLFKRFQKLYRKKTVEKSSEGGLYFYAHSSSFFQKVKPVNSKVQFSVLRSLHENFIRLYLGQNQRSVKFLKWLYRLEQRYPQFFGKHGAFGLIIYEKEGASS